MAVLWIAIGLSLALLVALPVVGFWKPWLLDRRFGDESLAALNGFLAAFMLGFVAVPAAYFYAQAHHDERLLDCTVTGTDSRWSRHFIATEQCGQLEGSGSSTSFWRCGYTVDVTEQIQPGRTYRLRVIGWQSSWTSISPCVLRIEGFP